MGNRPQPNNAGPGRHDPSAAPAQAVPVTLLGEPVTAWLVPNRREHRRRARIGLGAVTHPGLLDMLLNLPLGVPVDDPVAWAETAAQPDGIVDRGPDGRTIARRLDSPVRIHAVTVTAGSPILRAVQSTSLFAGFCRRWVVAARARVPVAAILEAKLCGVGLVTQGGQVLLDAGPPVAPTVDGWTWLLQEKAYGRMLRGPGRPQPAAIASAILG